jgi:HEAT repeat protein
MTLLSLIYFLATGLAAVSILTAIAMIVLRATRTRSEERAAHVRRVLVGSLVRALDRGSPPSRLLAMLRKNPRLARDIFAELAELIRGQSREKLFAIAVSCELDKWLRQQVISAGRADRRLAAEVLRLFGDSESMETLRRALDDRDDDVRLTAALSLVENHAALPLQDLVQRLSAGTRERSLLLRRLFQGTAISDPEGTLAVAQGRIGDRSLRTVAIAALGAAGPVEFGPALAAMESDPSTEVRAAIVTALAFVGHPCASDTVKRCLADPDWEVRTAAVDAVRRMGLSEAVQTLAELVDDEVWWVRFRASEALAALGEMGLAALRRLAADKSERSRRMAAMILAERSAA